MKKKKSILLVPTLPSAGRVAAERPGRFIFRNKAHMRLIKKGTIKMMSLIFHMWYHIHRKEAAGKYPPVQDRLSLSLYKLKGAS